MSREIKFRVWDGKEMREPPPLNEWDMEDGEFWVEYCDNPIMQFTGLQDKNGKDIYEGDIVRCSIFEGEQFDEHYSGIPVEVEWMDKSGGFYPFIIASGWRSSVEDVELLGNIHEHPDLLKR